MRTPATEIVTTFRIPAGIHTALRDASASNRRSLNAEVLTLLEEALAARKAGPRHPGSTEAMKGQEP